MANKSGAPKGNEFWKQRTKHGRNKIFGTPGAMWEAACEYFQWVSDNPLKESKAFSYDGQGFSHEIPKMRAMTLEGLCIFLGVNTKYFAQFELRLDLSTKLGEDFSNVLCNIRDVIREQKFTGAAAGLLNPTIIARDLGLKDEAKHEHTGLDGGPIATITREMTQEEAGAAYSEIINNSGNKQKKQ